MENPFYVKVKGGCKKPNKGKKYGLTIATWNTRGKNNEKKETKWKDIKRIMRAQRIAILAVQEARVTDKEAEKIEKDNPGILILNNGEHTNKMGILFAINTEIIKATEEGIIMSHKKIVKNRASRLKIKWGMEQQLDIVNIYAPNDNKEKVEFLKEIKEKIKVGKGEEICVMGDFNCVEDPIDRCPTRRDEKEVEKAMNELVKKLKLKDVWREMHREEKGHTFIQKATKSTARIIDRIYATEKLESLVYEAEIESTYEMSDHCMVVTKIMTDKLPYCGAGMWKLKTETIENKNFKELAKRELTKYKKEYESYLQKELETDERSIKELRSNGHNPQAMWNNMKKAIKEIAIRIEKDE